jgi:hypothetical protein
MFSGVFIAEEVDEGTDKGSGDTTKVDVETSRRPF